MQDIIPRTFKGTRDFLPGDMRIRDEILDKLKTVFTRYGFAPLETPAFEYLDILAGKYGEDADKLLYPLKYKGGNVLALRYDLTVPLSRVIAMNPHLPKPFKRYQIQPVWRADNPQLKRGRYREFYQCDVDTVGSTELLTDADIVALMVDAFRALGFKDAGVKINSRKLLRGIIIEAGFKESDDQAICRTIDKYDKVGLDEVKKELLEKKFDEKKVDKLLGLFDWQSMWQNGIEAIERLKGGPELRKGQDELLELFSILDEMGFSVANGDITFDQTLARGLDYYTGPIFEAVLRDSPEVGSVAGGGRYDELVGMFLKESVPAVGTSFGMERIFTLYKMKKDCKNERQNDLDCLVCYYSRELRGHNLSVLRRLREAGLSAELYIKPDKLGKQFNYANKKGIPYVVVAGPDEVDQSAVTVKDMKSGSQETYYLGEWLLELEDKRKR